MIKGVSRRIVEISNTDNAYFEKAVLYIRPEKMSFPQSQIETEAQYYLDNITPKIYIKKKKHNNVKYIITTLLIVLFLTALSYTAYYISCY